MTTGKTIDLTIQTFAGKVIPLLFNILSRFVIGFLPRSKCLVLNRLNFRAVSPERNISHFKSLLFGIFCVLQVSLILAKEWNFFKKNGDGATEECFFL